MRVVEEYRLSPQPTKCVRAPALLCSRHAPEKLVPVLLLVLSLITTKNVPKEHNLLVRVIPSDRLARGVAWRGVAWRGQARPRAIGVSSVAVPL